MIHHSVNKQPVTIIQSMHPHPAWGGGELKISEKSLLVRVRNFYFGCGGYIFGGRGGNFVGRGGSRNFEVKIKTT